MRAPHLPAERALFLTATLIASAWCMPSAQAAEGPQVIVQDPPLGVLERADGSFEFYNLREPHAPVVRSALDGQRVTIQPALTRSVPPGPLPPRMLEDEHGELHAIDLRGRGEGRQIAVDRFIDLHHRRTIQQRSQWQPAQPIWEGYCGALMQFTRLQSGRIVAPFGAWLPGRRSGPPTGPNVVTAVYSDDGGATWTKSSAQLTSPCYPGYNGSNYGACEPVVLERSDGRLDMLMRTQTGFLYRSTSDDGGATWQPARASRFYVSTGPPGLVRLPDGRIVLFWNHCEMPPRVDGQGVYAGRDAMHAAISDDEGRTWRGFREIYRDPYRNETPPKSGDRGTAYPFGVVDADGRLLVITGQGKGRRNVIRFDPDWLLATSHGDDFSNGLDAWHVFKPFGPATGFWRDRTVGPVIVDDSKATGGKALHLRRPNDRDADGASWNFPLGWKGTLAVRLKPQGGFGGASLALLDRMFEPTDDHARRLGIFVLEVAPDGSLRNLDGLQFEHDRWQTLTLRWDLDAGECEVELNGSCRTLTQRHPSLNGLSYLQLRSLADEVDRAGWLVDSVRVEIDDPIAPPRSEEEIERQEVDYREHWTHE